MFVLNALDSFSTKLIKINCFAGKQSGCLRNVIERKRQHRMFAIALRQ